MNKNQQQKITLHLTSKLPQLQAIYLFGSESAGEAKSDSDIDIAILSKSNIAKHDLFTLQSELELLLNKDVDLVNLRTCSEVFQAQVIYKGSRIYNHKESLKEVELFEDRVFQSYLYLKENIRPILEETKNSGQIYG
jgi:predicted nucleotidyltransferase